MSDREKSLDLLRTKLEVARQAQSLAVNDTPEVQAAMEAYVRECEKLVEKASYGA